MMQELQDCSSWGWFLEPAIYFGVVMARLRSTGISPVFSEVLYSSWRG